MVSQAQLSFDSSLCGASGPDAYAEVRVGLSWHNYGAAAAQELVYRLVPAGGQSSIVSSSTRVTVTVSLSTTHVQVSLSTHASLLHDGDDNAIQDIYLKVGTRNSATSCLQIGNFRIHSLQPLPAQLVQEHKRVAQRNQTAYGVNEFTSWDQFAGQRHLNPYMPSSASLLPGASDIQVENVVPLVPAVNGLVALNHPFGAGSGAVLPPAEQETRVQSLLDTPGSGSDPAGDGRRERAQHSAGKVWSSTNQPLALSNHIYIPSLQCDVNGNGQTNIVDLQLVAGAFGRTVPPAPVAYDLQKNGQIDLWDILTAAEC